MLAGNLALVKSGSGTLALTASNNFTGSTIVSGGTLNLSGSISNAAQMIATNTATLQLSSGIITANLVRIYTNAFLLGCGSMSLALGGDKEASRPPSPRGAGRISKAAAGEAAD